jgi:hypothetical protein
MKGQLDFGEEKKDSKRTLSIREKIISYLKANKRCENPARKEEIDFAQMLAYASVGDVIIYKELISRLHSSRSR